MGSKGGLEPNADIASWPIAAPLSGTTKTGGGVGLGWVGCMSSTTSDCTNDVSPQRPARNGPCNQPQADPHWTFGPGPLLTLPKASAVRPPHRSRGLVTQPPVTDIPPPCHSPPHVVPRGEVGDRHLVNPKFFFAGHCVVVWVTVLWGTATCSPCTHGRTFCSLSLKWNFMAQPCFPLGQV